MKRILLTFLAILGLALVSCRKAPELTLSGPTSIDSSADGSSGTITFAANRDWTVSSSDSWVSVSPSSGSASDTPVTLSIRCNANTTYEDRTATVTIRMEDLSQTVTVRQPANLGVVLPKQVFDLQCEAKSIDVEVQANVQYTVSTSVDWIKQTGTKGLTSKILTFSIEENTTYDSREGKIAIKPQEGNAQEQVVSVRQAQKDALIVEKTSYDMPYGGGDIEIKVETNVDFEVKSDAEWVHYVETKALNNATIYLTVDENKTYSTREGRIDITQKNGSLKHTITVAQAGRIAVTSVNLNKTTLSLLVGESEALTATVKPDNATDKSVTWSSTDKSVATVDESGKVTAVAEGSAVITATVGEISAICNTTVSSFVKFEDETFKAFCVENYDTNSDGEISNTEALLVQEINCSLRQIRSLVGIKSFKNVTVLNCEHNLLTSLDVSGCDKLQQLICSGNQYSIIENGRVVTIPFSNLDVSGCVSLTILYCNSTGLTDIDVSTCRNLYYLFCSRCSLKSLDVSGLSLLETVWCNNNELSTIKVNGCSALESLECSTNQLSLLDLSGCSALKRINCQYNQLSEILLSGCVRLEKINCGDNQLSELDFSDCAAIKEISCFRNHITNLDVRGFKKLECLVCTSNQLSSLDLSGCDAFWELQCEANKLESLTLPESIIHLLCGDNQLTELDVSNYKQLTDLQCGKNYLKHLDVSGLKELYLLTCGSNQLSSLTLNGCDELYSLNCSSNYLTTLDVSSCSSLENLECNNNLLSTLDLSGCAGIMYDVRCSDNPSLSEIWLKSGQVVKYFKYDSSTAQIKYKDL